MNAATSDFVVVPVQYRCSTLWSFFHLDDEQSTLSYVFHGMQFLMLYCIKYMAKSQFMHLLVKKNSTNRGPPVVSFILVVFYVQMYVYLVQDRVFHTGRSIFQAT